MRLEEGSKTTFPETTFYISENNECRYWLKNDNVSGEKPKVWRYAHYHSAADRLTKKKVLVATLRKLHKMTNDDNILTASALQKLHEFATLQYPLSLLKQVCNLLAATTRNPTWFRVRQALA